VRRARLVAPALAALLLLTGCTEQGAQTADSGYISAGDGAWEQWKQPTTAPVTFSGTTVDGTTFSSKRYLGKVVVVNFWYAGCAPCRAEAPILQGLYSTYQDRGAMFLGVNVVDQAPTAISFEKAHGVSYPSVLDSATGTARNAFSGAVSASTVPVTFVLDKKGRIAARIVGELQSKSILDTLITDTLAEKN
jgi:thiol-disulfide isomerase/thioredoxin